MTALENEAAVLQMAEPFIRDYCIGKWTCISMEDRISEATYIFLIVLRTRSIPEEHVWPVFCRTLDKHMRALNSQEAWHRFHCKSLDAPVRMNNGEEGSSLHELIPSPQADFPNHPLHSTLR